MWKFMCVMLMCLAAGCHAGPYGYQKKNMPIMAREDVEAMPTEQHQQQQEMSEEPAGPAAEAAAPMVGTLTLPSNATSIRADITDNFSCANKSYGYYADVENDCQIFHVCLPVTYADGKENTFRWSFICPEETIFSQESFTCMRREDMGIECADSHRYYELNSNFGSSAEEDSSNMKPAAAAATIEAEEEPQMQGVMEQPKPMEPQPAAEPVMQPAMEPMQQPAKPVKQQKPKPKPNRRKPALTYNKMPQPQRKVPAAPTATVAALPAESIMPVAQQTASEQSAKPMKPQRFGQRPSMANKEKEKEKEKEKAPMQPVKLNVPPTRHEMFNANRKRPAVFNKLSVSSTAKPVQEAEIVTEAVVQLELNEPKPTLKLEAMFGGEPIAQASEAAVVIAQPEEPTPAVAADQVFEAIEEIPAVITETLEQQPPASEAIATPAEETKLTAAAAEPAIVELSNSDEEALSTIEALEMAKPADAPESMPAIPEMTENNELVEQVLQQDETLGSGNQAQQESIGGFKPVDPAMAAEAEQLITDFLNTLRKNEEKHETEQETEMKLPMAEMLPAEQSQETLLKHTNEAVSSDEAVSIEEAKLPEPEVSEKDASIEEHQLEAEQPEPQAPQMLKHDSPITNIMMNAVPAEFYHIPVKVIEMPAAAAVQPVEAAATEPAKPAEQPASESQNAAGFVPPISIDDIVELVKERLDQTPKTEQMTPMELVLTPGASEPMTLVQNAELPAKEEVAEAQPVKEEVAEAQPAAAAAEQPVEDIILPIYKRVGAAEPSMTKVQTAPVTADKVDTPLEAAEQQQEVRQPKYKRHLSAANSSKMDARKRRFLFRADAK